MTISSQDSVSAPKKASNETASERLRMKEAEEQRRTAFEAIARMGTTDTRTEAELEARKKKRPETNDPRFTSTKAQDRFASATSISSRDFFEENTGGYDRAANLNK